MGTLNLASAGVVAAALLAGIGIGAVAQSVDDSAAPVAIPSIGCGAAVVEPGTHRGLPVVVDSVEQRFSMRVPESYDGTTPVPLWLQFHGGGLSASSALPKVTNTADDHGFVAVAPEGFFGGPLGQSGWGWRPDDTEIDLTSANPDIAFMHALIDHAAETLCIDLARVYAAGFSNGGGAATVASCALDDRIAAVASVAGLVFDFGDACGQVRPVPYLAVHGKTDRQLHFDGGSIIDHPIKDRYISAPIPDRVAAIAARNGCESEPTVEAVTEDAERSTWSCPADADVQLIAIDGWQGGHTWQAMGEIDASELIWAFFDRHALPE